MTHKLIWLLRAFAILLCTSMIWWMLWVDFQRQDLVEATDFANSCYVAGKIVQAGNLSQLYPVLTTSDYIHSRFPAVAHQLLSTLPVGSHPVWQYSPLNAFLFSFFSFFSVQTALLVWQILNGCATVAIAVLIAKSVKIRVLDAFLFCFSFAPWFMMIKFGQQGIIFGVLPLCLGYWLAQRNRSVLAGLSLSITFLNPKYMLAAGLFAAIIFCRNRKVLPTLLICVASWTTILFLSAPQLVEQWLHSLKLAERYLLDPHFIHQTTIYASLPALSILNLPVEFRDAVKVLCYAAAVLVGVATLFVGIKVSKKLAVKKFFLLALTLSFLSMPVIEPHLLFYDLAGAAIGILGLWKLSKPEMPTLGGISILLWLTINSYFVLLAFQLVKTDPMVFVLILTIVYIQILRSLVAYSRLPHATDAIEEDISPKPVLVSP